MIFAIGALEAYERGETRPQLLAVGGEPGGGRECRATREGALDAEECSALHDGPRN